MDSKDLKILNILAQNCRIANTTIATALHISKDTVTYRIRQLQSQGYLRQYMLFVDARRLGFTRYHILIRFDPAIEDKKKIIERTARHPFVMWINTFIGRYDAQIIVDASNGFHLNSIREELFRTAKHGIQEYTVLTHLLDLEFTQLSPIIDVETSFTRKDDSSFSKSLTTRNFPVGADFDRYLPLRVENEILRLLADDPCSSLVDIASKVGTDRQTVKKHIQTLINHKVILNFGGITDHSKFGFITYYLLVRITQDTPLQTLKQPFASLHNIFYAGRMLGDYDMIIYLNARNPQELNESIELFKSKLGKHILHYDLLVQDRVHHWRQYSAGIHDHLVKSKENQA
ncbi:MAG: Lrp/AsnC family transcriptional regulator [Nanoarchaeota archaeon]